MSRLRTVGSLCLALLLLAACDPEERFDWSPDGKHAVVVLEERLHLADSEGRLLTEIVEPDPGVGEHKVRRAKWMPDGSGILVHRVRAVASWEEARALLSAEEVARIEQLSAAVPALFTLAATLNSDESLIEAALSYLAQDELAYLGPAFEHARQTQPDALRRAVEGSPELLEALSPDAKPEPYSLHELMFFSVSAVDSGGALAIGKSPRVIVRGLKPMGLFEVSPHFPVITCAFPLGEVGKRSSLVRLSIRALDGSFETEWVDEVHGQVAWTADGRSAIRVIPAAGEESLINRIQRVTLLDPSGALLPDEKREVLDLATALVPFAPRVAALPDGRVLFSSQPGALPWAGQEPPSAPQFYLVPGDGGEIAAVPSAPGSLPMELSHFVLSLDGKRFALVESQSDTLAVVDVATGESTIVSPPHAMWKCRTLPAWRSSTELSFAALNEASGRIEWKLWNSEDGSMESLSEAWPDDATKDWVERKETDR